MRLTLHTRTCIRHLSSLKDVQSCQDYLDICRVKGSNLTATVFRGTLYELTAKKALEQSLNFFDLKRVGGAGDNGLDLLGRWDLSKYHEPLGTSAKPKGSDESSNGELGEVKPLKKVPSSSLLSACTPYSARKKTIDLSEDVAVLVQCKNHKSKIKASTVRELAGIREFHINMSSKLDRLKTFMVLVSPLPATKQALRQMDTSDVPMLHVQVSSLSAPEKPGPGDYVVENWTGGVLGPVYLNYTARMHLQGLTVERSFSEVVR